MRPEKAIGERLKELGLKLSAAESCTGGLLSAMLTDIPGSSEYFMGSVVAYDNGVKTALLGVQEETLKKYGAVSRQAASEMAEGVRKRLSTGIGVSITGIAGPGGGTPKKPVGTVFIGIAHGNRILVKKFLFKGGRKAVRKESAMTAMALIGKVIKVKGG